MIGKAGSCLAFLLALALAVAGAALAAPPHRRAADPSTVIDDTLKAALATAPKSSEFPESDAVCLLDLSTVDLLPDGTVVETVRKAYKLFNQRARTLAEVTLPYNSSRETLEIVAARTVRANGKIAPVRKDDERFTAPGEDYALYSDSVSAGFSLPMIEDNCVIDYTYRKVKEPDETSKYASSWSFVGRYPVKLSRLTVNAPKSRALRYKIYNDDVCKPIVQPMPGGKAIRYMFERRDLSAIVTEPMLPYPLEVIPYMEVSAYDSWSQTARAFGDARADLKPGDPAAAMARSLAAGKSSPAETASAIYDWVVKNVRYVGVDLSSSGYRPHPASEIFKKRYGDSKDKTNLLIAMLAVAGIHADRALLGAGNPIDVESRLPTLQTFTHCIAVAKIDGHDVWLDASASTCPYGDIPQADRGTHALVLAAGKPEFRLVPPYQMTENTVEDYEKVEVHPDGSASITDRVVLRGSFAQSFRASMQAITPAQREETAKRMALLLGNAAVLTGSSLPDGFERTDHAELTLSIEAPQYAQQADDLLLVPFTGTFKPQNPFVQETRRYPFEQATAVLVKADVVITIPDGYDFTRIPADVSLTSPVNRQHIVFIKAADGRSVTIHALTETERGSAPASAFQAMKDYYQTVARISSQKIVIKKRSP